MFSAATYFILYIYYKVKDLLKTSFTVLVFPHVMQETIATVAGDGSGDGPDKALTVFMCEECNSVFLNQDALAVHILAEHMPKETNLSAGKLAWVFYLLFSAFEK